MASLIDRVQELTAEAKELGLINRVHARDIELRVMGYADVLGYDVDEAMDPELPLRRVKDPES